VHPLTETSHASAAARALRDPENRSIQIGIACTILLHVLLAFVAPRLPVELLHGTFGPSPAASPGHDFNIELAPDIAAPEPKTDPFRFVETNPDAPANEPDQTANFSNRNQQSANPDKPEELDAENRPAIKGDDTIKNDTAIVSGDSERPQPGTYVISSAAATAQDAAAAQAARAEQVPLSGVEKLTGESPDGIGSSRSESKQDTTNAEEYVEGVRAARNTAGAAAAPPAAAPRAPAPRPKLSQARPAILQNRIAGTWNVGPIGIDAKWSEFGDYMQELIDIVDAQWRNLLNARTARPAAGTNATITFKLTAQGLIQIVSVEETCGPAGTYVSLSAIQDRQPYRKWTKEMVAVLGEEQTITFGFYFRY